MKPTNADHPPPPESSFSVRLGGPIAPPRSYVLISALIRASKRHPDQGTTKAQRSQIVCCRGFWDLWMENRGAPKTPNPTTMDPTPHSRPSEVKGAPKQFVGFGVSLWLPLRVMWQFPNHLLQSVIICFLDEKGTQTQTFWSGYFPVG